MDQRVLPDRMREVYASQLKVHLLPEFGGFTLVGITAEHVRKWNSSLLTGLVPQELALSIEADLVSPEDPEGKKATVLDGVIGELSPFHDLHGFHVDGVTTATARLARGWQTRVVPFAPVDANGVLGLCLHPNDLAANANIRSDYLTTQLIFSPEAQGFVLRSAFTPDLKSFVTSAVTGRLNKPTVPGRPLTYQSPFFQFERALLLADELNAHTIELRREFEVLSVDLSGTEAVVVVEEESAGMVTFDLLQAPSGKWRIRRILTGGSTSIEEPTDGTVYVLRSTEE